MPYPFINDKAQKYRHVNETTIITSNTITTMGTLRLCKFTIFVLFICTTVEVYNTRYVKSRLKSWGGRGRVLFWSCLQHKCGSILFSPRNTNHNGAIEWGAFAPSHTTVHANYRLRRLLGAWLVPERIFLPQLFPYRQIAPPRFHA